MVKKAPAKKGMGFAAAAKATGKPPAQANAIIAAAARKASPTAKKANPNLKKVATPKKGAMPKKGSKGSKGK
jgi:hypothetical protein